MQVYKIAGLNAAFDAKFEFTYEMCKGYEAEEGTEPELTVSVALEEIEEEYKDSPLKDMGYCEYICLYRKMCSQIPQMERLLMHAAVIEVDGEAYAFTAKSGVGKTTHIRLWRKLLGKRVGIVNGDKPIIRFDKDRIIACGTPWSGKEKFQRNCEYPLKALCFVTRGEENKIRSVDTAEALPRLYQQTFIPEDRDGAYAALGLVTKLAETVPMFEIACNISTDAAALAYETMSKAAAAPLK